MSKQQLPSVPRSHEIARAASRALIAKLPAAWTCNEPIEGDDYGIDLTVGIAHHAAVTGRYAHIQVKGTESSTGEDEVAVRMKRTTIALLQALTEAAVIAVVDIEQQKLWFTHAGDEVVIKSLLSRSKEYVTIRLSSRHKVTFEDFYYSLDKLSYRKAWLSKQNLMPIGIGCTSPQVGANLLLRLQPHLPLGLRITIDDEPATQLLLGPVDGRPALLDLAVPGAMLLLPEDPSSSDIVCGLAVFCLYAELRPLAGHVLATACDLLCEKLIYPNDLLHILLHECSAGEQGKVVRSAIRRRMSWAPDWMLRLYVNARHFDLTADDVQRAFRLRDSRGPVDWFQEAQVLLALNHATEARALAESCLSDGRFPGAPYEMYQVARFYEAIGERTIARKWYSDLAAQAGSPRIVRLRLAILNILDGALYAAQEMLSSDGDPDPFCKAIFFLCSLAIKYAKMLSARLGEDVFRCPERLSETFNACLDAGKPFDVCLLIGISLIEALRTNDKKWWARLVTWSDRAMGDNDGGAYLRGNVLNYCSVDHGADPIRLVVAMANEEDTRKAYEALYNQFDTNRKRPLLIAGVYEFPMSAPKLPLKSESLSPKALRREKPKRPRKAK